MNFMLLGVLCGILAGLIIALIACLIRKDSDSAPKFDERQIASQNVAYKRGFFAMIICCVLSGLALCYDGFPFPLREGAVGLFVLSCMVGMLVFAVTAIVKDAYFGYNQNMRKWYIIFGCLALCCGVNAYDSLQEGDAAGWIFLAVGLVMLSVLLAALLHRRRHPMTEEDDE